MTDAFKKITAFITIFFTLFLSYSCSDDSTGPNTTPKTITVTGKLTAPDGSTPISGATVYVGKPLQQSQNQTAAYLSAGSFQVKCKAPSVDYKAYTCTNADGSFELDIEVSKEKIKVYMFKGSFYTSVTINVPNGETAEVGEVKFGEDSVEMAVVTGSFDRMEDILAKAGYGEIGSGGRLILGTETFDLYDGDFGLPEEYPSMQDLFADNDGDGKADLFNYDLIFIDCGASEEPISAGASLVHSHSHATVAYNTLSVDEVDALKQFITQGGTLYATDWAYDFVEQTFPEYIDFLGSDDTPQNQSEEPNAAEVGEGEITTEATVLQNSLKNWLMQVKCFGDQSCFSDDGTIHIKSFLSAWAVIDKANSDANTTVWVEGNVSWRDPSFEYKTGVQPLTVSFHIGEGTVIYSSYHTVHAVGPVSANWEPQERILQYLVFE